MTFRKAKDLGLQPRVTYAAKLSIFFQERKWSFNKIVDFQAFLRYNKSDLNEKCEGQIVAKNNSVWNLVPSQDILGGGREQISVTLEWELALSTHGSKTNCGAWRQLQQQEQFHKLSGQRLRWLENWFKRNYFCASTRHCLAILLHTNSSKSQFQGEEKYLEPQRISYPSWAPTGIKPPWKHPKITNSQLAMKIEAKKKP